MTTDTDTCLTAKNRYDVKLKMIDPTGKNKTWVKEIPVYGESFAAIEKNVMDWSAKAFPKNQNEIIEISLRSY
ncbi:MAG: hypothetical protein GY714_01895 [Desulfobacterales bacterium]|nr:hypothetical protein [Desulfobacterales bacterium]